MEQAADRIRALPCGQAPNGLGDVVVNDDDHSLTVYWKGPLSPQATDLLRELRCHVAVDVRPATYSEVELGEEAYRITGLDVPGIRITSVGPMPDCSGLRITLDVGCDPAQASRAITSRIPLEFAIGPPATALSLI